MTLSLEQRQRVIQAIVSMPEFRDAGVAYLGGGMSQVLREPRLPDGIQTWVILKEVDDPPEPLGTIAPAGSHDVGPAGRESKVFAEVGLSVLSCGSAVLAGAAATAGAAAAPVTGGGSLALTVLTWAGATASAAQCGISLGRVFNEITDPSANDVLDSTEWFTATADVLDGIALAGGFASLGQAAQAAVRLSRTSGRPLRQILKGMNRAERKRLAQDIARYTGQAETRRQFLRAAARGSVPKVFSVQEVNKAVLSHLLDSVGYALTVTGSSAGGGLIQKHVLVHIFQQNP